MPANDLVLTNEQLALVGQPNVPVPVRDAEGNLRGYLRLIVSAEELDEARRVLAVQEPRYTTAQVLAALQSRVDS